MCCFSQPVISVSATNIFAREGERQFLVYSMSIQAKKDLAMILPLPVKPGSGEKAVEFIDIKDSPDFFNRLEKGFVKPVSHKAHFSLGIGAASASLPPLEVVEVGDFEASFVPTVQDFSRLDDRFRLPAGTWDELPAYRDYGFAVFKLKPMAMQVHPMAFTFPRRDTKTLFFPTVHIHDGKVHEKAKFDHALFCQPRENQHLELDRWKESNGLADSFMPVFMTKGVVLGDQHCYKKEMRGQLPNRDTLVGVNG